ncbi:hypothetical protein H4217_001265 [Coemansia sp. RSA 1939]|nr:hypothetical protein H4217_001265 [Coemansia sp. RSA 1939]KAJ2616203.1 hypothetical protein EV177_001181 [Coemansia sp. RSA 1804]
MNNSNKQTPAMDFSSAQEFADNSPYISGSDAQKTMPITPSVGPDVFPGASTGGIDSRLHSSRASMLPITEIHDMAPGMAAIPFTIANPVPIVAPQATLAGVDATHIHNELADIFGDAMMFSSAGNQASICEYPPPISFGNMPAANAPAEGFASFSGQLQKMPDNIFDEFLPHVSASPAHPPGFAAPATIPTHQLFPDMTSDGFASTEMMAAAMAAAAAATATPATGVTDFSLSPGTSSQAMFSPMVPGFAGIADGALFGQPRYASGSITASAHAFMTDEAAAMVSEINNSNSKAEDIGMHTHVPMAGANQSNLSTFVLTPGMQDIATPNMPTGDDSAATAISSGRSLTSGFGNISLDSMHQTTQPHSFQYPPRRAASYASRLSSMRPKRSLSSGKIATARMSPFASGPSTSMHPYMVHRGASPGGSVGAGESLVASPRIDRLYGHVPSEPEACTAETSGPAAGISRTQSIVSVQSSPSVWGIASVAPSVAGEDDSSEAPSDDESSDHDAAPGSTSQRGGKSSGSGRIALTNEQREIFFRWLFENTHDPKPKGKERERLRRIGNMSRGRFKTWFANARRRYFHVVTDAEGKQTYVVNERFKIACHRSNVKFE